MAGCCIIKVGRIKVEQTKVEAIDLKSVQIGEILPDVPLRLIRQYQWVAVIDISMRNARLTPTYLKKFAA